jgi:hypothetical protein
MTASLTTALTNSVIHSASIDCIPDNRGGAIEVRIEMIEIAGSASDNLVQPEIVVHGMDEPTLTDGRIARGLARMLDTAADKLDEITVE